MKLAYFPGCKIPAFLEYYGTASRAVLKALDVELVDIEFNCCGYPIRNLDYNAFVLSAARNLALAESKNLDIITPCQCCFGNFKHAQAFLRENPELMQQANSDLAAEGLTYRGQCEVKHFSTVLDQDIGLEAIRSRVRIPLEEIKIAVTYGCHALRPSKITHYDDPFGPTILERLVEAAGAQNVPWLKRLDCCGHPLVEKNKDLAMSLMRRKIEDARGVGAHYLCTSCTYCQLQFDGVQADDAAAEGYEPIPAVTYAQLLGLSLGLSEKELGLTKTRQDLGRLKEISRKS